MIAKHLLVHLKSGQTIKLKFGPDGEFTVSHNGGSVTEWKYRGCTSHTNLFIDPVEIVAVEWVK